MTRRQLAYLLADLILRKAITQAEAERLLDLFDAGELDELPPFPPPANDDDWLLALALLLLLAGGNTTTRLSAAKRRLARNTLRRGFDLNVTALAISLASDSVRAAAWQSAMIGTISQYTLQMAVAGAGGLPGGPTRMAVGGMLGEQWAFLARFALTIVAREAGGRGLTVAAIADRAKLYGGVAWASFWLGQGDTLGAGYVERWYARDDISTCDICAGFNGNFYLPGSPPFPGQDCRGRGRCRCERVPVYNPEVYARLTGRKVAA